MAWDTPPFLRQTQVKYSIEQCSTPLLIIWLMISGDYTTQCIADHDHLMIITVWWLSQSSDYHNIHDLMIVYDHHNHHNQMMIIIQWWSSSSVSTCIHLANAEGVSDVILAEPTKRCARTPWEIRGASEPWKMTAAMLSTNRQMFGGFNFLGYIQWYIILYYYYILLLLSSLLYIYIHYNDIGIMIGIGFQFVSLLFWGIMDDDGWQRMIVGCWENDRYMI